LGDVNSKFILVKVLLVDFVDLEFSSDMLLVSLRIPRLIFPLSCEVDLDFKVK
jgi:hypothetical protein